MKIQVRWRRGLALLVKFLPIREGGTADQAGF
jgi:hypothetical protein